MQSILLAELVYLGLMVIRYILKEGISISEGVGLVGDHPLHAWSHFKEVDNSWQGYGLGGRGFTKGAHRKCSALL